MRKAENIPDFKKKASDKQNYQNHFSSIPYKFFWKKIKKTLNQSEPVPILFSERLKKRTKKLEIVQLCF